MSTQITWFWQWPHQQILWLVASAWTSSSPSWCSSSRSGCSPGACHGPPDPSSRGSSTSITSETQKKVPAKQLIPTIECNICQKIRNYGHQICSEIFSDFIQMTFLSDFIRKVKFEEDFKSSRLLIIIKNLDCK